MRLIQIPVDYYINSFGVDSVLTEIRTCFYSLRSGLNTLLCSVFNRKGYQT